MEAGKSYDDAYSDAIDATLAQRQIMQKLAKSHFKLVLPDSITRYAGTIDPEEK
jgi:hypothetical protein